VVELAFAVKANPNLAVMRHLAATGLGADVASGGELRHALRAGFGSSRIVFTGPGKRDEELRAAVEAGVRAVTVEAPGELRRLGSIAGSLGRRQAVLLRAAVSEASHEGVRLVGDHGAGKFGMDLPDLATAAAEAVASPWLEPLGIHAFGASNITDAAALGAHVEATVATAIDVAATAGFTLRLVDAGGGLGIPYATHEDELDIRALGARLQVAADRLAAWPGVAGDARILLEPGRFLVGASGAYVARVVDGKTVGGRHVVILDGGIHHVLRPVLVGQEHRVRVLSGTAAARSGGPAIPTSGRVTVAGPLCSGLDVFAEAAMMAAPEVGDLVAVLDTGAYGATESMPLFLSHPLPPEVALQGGRAWISRPRVEPDVWLGWQTDEPAAD
jgi:diaminopimelate decarboxylase